MTNCTFPAKRQKFSEFREAVSLLLVLRAGDKNIIQNNNLDRALLFVAYRCVEVIRLIGFSGCWVDIYLKVVAS